jgi:hypothetical protein
MPYKDPEKRRAAKRASRKRYVPTNTPCQYGHVAGRFGNGTCKECHNTLTRTAARKIRAERHEPDHCELCGRHRGARRLCLDHDHTNGRFRGWLCFPCNMGLGQLQDRPELLRLAADYVERHRG